MNGIERFQCDIKLRLLMSFPTKCLANSDHNSLDYIKFIDENVLYSFGVPVRVSTLRHGHTHRFLFPKTGIFATNLLLTTNDNDLVFD